MDSGDLERKRIQSRRYYEKNKDKIKIKNRNRYLKR